MTRTFFAPMLFALCVTALGPKPVFAGWLELLEVGMTCPGDNRTGERNPAPGTLRGSTGVTRAGTEIEIPGSVVVYARDASFGPKVWLRGSLEPRVIDIEVDRPYFNERVLEHWSLDLWPGEPRILFFTFGSHPERVIGHWEYRVSLDGEEMLRVPFEVLAPEEAPNHLDACKELPIS